MTILLLYTSFIKITKTDHIEAPSLVQYSQLQSKYPTTLTCPCSKISIKYENILHIEYTLHQVCNSIFINQSWNDPFINHVKLELPGNDFRLTSPHTFQALQTFCDLINDTISHSRIQFYSNQYVNPSVRSLDLFQSETESLVNEFRSSMITSLLSSLSMIRDTTQGNGLFSGLKANYVLKLADNGLFLEPKPLSYGGCICSSSSTCTISSAIYAPITGAPLYHVPGLLTGCYVIESLLKSTLECFYSQQCRNELKDHMLGYERMPIIVLDASLSSNYSENSTIQELVDNLMIEQWNFSSKYETYYNECQPKSCTYTFETRNDMIYIFTTLFGMAGGLTTILQFLLPRLVKFIMYCIQKQRTRVVPEVSVIGHN